MIFRSICERPDIFKVLTGIGNLENDNVHSTSNDWSKPVRTVLFCLTRTGSRTICKTQWNLRGKPGASRFPHFEGDIGRAHLIFIYTCSCLKVIWKCKKCKMLKKKIWEELNLYRD